MNYAKNAHDSCAREKRVAAKMWAWAVPAAPAKPRPPFFLIGEGSARSVMTGDTLGDDDALLAPPAAGRAGGGKAARNAARAAPASASVPRVVVRAAEYLWRPAWSASVAASAAAGATISPSDTLTSAACSPSGTV